MTQAELILMHSVAGLQYFSFFFFSPHDDFLSCSAESCQPPLSSDTSVNKAGFMLLSFLFWPIFMMRMPCFFILEELHRTVLGFQ